MKRKSTIAQQVTAVCLLAVFLLITAAKLFHTHGIVSPAADFSNSQHIANSSDCPVCDYHFTKDTDHVAVVVTPAKPIALSAQDISYESRTASSIGLSYSDRGPPSLI